MTDKPAKSTSTFSKYTKGLLSRPSTGVAQDVKPLETQQVKASLRDLSFTADNAISAIACSLDKQRVVIAGRELLSILHVETDSIVEKYNLRLGNRANINYSSNDVKWGTGATSEIVATAASNGTIVTWNLEQPVSQRIDRVINGHNRAVNRLDFNPGNGSWLLSASQDGSMKLWDLRDRDGNSRFVLHGKAEAVRDVQFNFTNALELAAVYDNGTLQKWDLRNPKIYERKLNAHNGPALTLNWHADGRHLVTGGRDKMIKVWDLKSDMRKPARFLYTMAPVARVSWRPGTNISNCHIASCAFSMDNSISVWNLRRPNVAARVLEAHTAAPTGILWKDADTLLSCSKDCTLRQQQVTTAVAPIDIISHYAFGWTNIDDIAISLGSRKLDKQRTRVQEKKSASANSSTVNLSQEYRKGAKRSVSPRQRTTTNVLDTKASLFLPNQIFGIISSDENSLQLFKHFALRYITSGDNPIRACASNALTSYQAHQPEKSKSWKLIKLVLEHSDRSNKRIRVHRKPSIHDSLTPSRLGDSLIRRDLERLRLTPRLPESGISTMRGSPSNSFIMPRYADGVPPLSLPAARGSRTNSTILSDHSPHMLTIQEKSRDRLQSSDDTVSKLHDMILPGPATADDVGMERTAGAPASVTSHGSDPPSISRPPSVHTFTEQSDSSRQDDSDQNSLHPVVDEPSPRDVMSPVNNREISKQSPFGPMMQQSADEQTRGNIALLKTVKEILNQYIDLGDVQMCATICLVLGKQRLALPDKQVEEWVYSYVELLQRQRLFVTAAEVINHSQSDLVRSLAEGDIVMHTTCSRCKKAVPLIREVGEYWTCPRCQNTVQCIVCGTVIKGRASWCRSCAHSAHQECRQVIVRELDGMCVVPDCACQCQL